MATGRASPSAGACPHRGFSNRDPFRAVRATSMLMSLRTLLCTFAFAAFAGCGLDLGGQQFVPATHIPPDGALTPPSVGATDAGSPAARDGDRTAAEAAFGQDADLMQQGLASPNAASR